eukprot:Nitzschia sp. Nitz4//scaffold20_size174350//14515//15249//NITZ4_002077-RA/size174350-processed-gene-0.84-mRNA-1//-1//CDS//3329541734//7072//frame0
MPLLFFNRKQRKTQQKIHPTKDEVVDDAKRFYTIGGVYTVDENDAKAAQSMKSLDTVGTGTTDNSEESRDWSSSGKKDHNRGAPMIAKNFSLHRIVPDSEDLSEDAKITRINLHSRRLPTMSNGYMASNHVMINSERTLRYIPPLKRSPAMDELARAHAKMMAEESQLFHSDRQQLYESLASAEPGRRVGENVTKGGDMKGIHQYMMRSLADKNNILDRRFTEMGVGTAKAADGTLYLCQLFRD